MFDPYNYTITIRKGNFGGEICFNATILEFPDVAEYGDSFEEVYLLAVDTIKTTKEIFDEIGRKMPIPNNNIEVK